MITCNWRTGFTPVRGNRFEWCLDSHGSLHIRTPKSRFALSEADLVSLVAYLDHRPRCLGNGKADRSATIPPGDAIGWDFIVGTLGRSGCQMWASHVVGVLLQCEVVVQVDGPCGRRAYRTVRPADWQSARVDLSEDGSTCEICPHCKVCIFRQFLAGQAVGGVRLGAGRSLPCGG
jgi:hypothetical protein